MKTLSSLIGLLATVVASAQFGGMGMDMMFGPMGTLPRKDIQKELKLTKEQSKQIDELMKSLNGGGSDASAINLGSLGKVDAQLMAVLDERQKERYFELSIQIRGATALSDPVVAKKLELTEEQTASAKRIRKATQDKVLDAARKGSRDSKLMENASKAEEKELLALLTEDQKAAFTKLAGEIYKGARIKGMWPI